MSRVIRGCTVVAVLVAAATLGAAGQAGAAPKDQPVTAAPSAGRFCVTTVTEAIDPATQSSTVMEHS